MGALIDHREDIEYFCETYASVTFARDGIDWEALAAIYADAGFAPRTAAEIRRAFVNSYHVCFARVGGRLVGAARATSDGIFHATIVDVVVDPGFQRAGIGRKMMRALLARLPFPKIYLTTVPGKEGFYEKLGFRHQALAMGLQTPPPAGGAAARC